MELEQFTAKFSQQFEESDMENIASDTDFKQLETWDSLTAFSVQMMIEDDFNVKINPTDFKEAKTVKDLYHLVHSRI